MAINFSDLGGGGGGGPSMRIDRITSTGTWTCPDDVTEIDVALAGGGGSGAVWGNVPNSGGGGSLEIERLSVVPGTTYTVTIGAGGARVNGQAAGNPGTASSFGNLLTADGAPGGISNTYFANNTSFGGECSYEVPANSNAVTDAVRVSARAGGRVLGGAVFEGFLLGGGGGSNIYNINSGLGGPGAGNKTTKNGKINTGAGGIGGYNQSPNTSGAGGSGVCIIRYWSAL